jgi:hypothetical protein
MRTGQRFGVIRLGLALLLSGLVAGCSGGDGVPTLNAQVTKAAVGAVKARTAAKAQQPAPLTRAALNTVPGSYIEVVLERRDALAYLSLSGARRDDAPGQIQVWRSQDNASVAMRNGVLIQTRGLGGDILSSSVHVRGDAPGPSAGGERVMLIRALDNKELRLSLACDLRDLGPETIEIVQTRYATRHLQERCEGGEGAIRNDYWVDSRSGLVWQSRQWAGPYIGYMRTRRLTTE